MHLQIEGAERGERRVVATCHQNIDVMVGVAILLPSFLPSFVQLAPLVATSTSQKLFGKASDMTYIYMYECIYNGLWCLRTALLFGPGPGPGQMYAQLNLIGLKLQNTRLLIVAQLN